MATLYKQELTSTWSGVRLVRLNDQCATFLGEIEKVPGVSGAFVCDNYGKALVALMTGIFNRALLNQVGSNLVKCLAAFQSRSASKELELRFENQILYLRELGYAFGIVLITSKSNLSLLRMTLNIAAGIIENDAELQASLKQAAPLRAGVFSPNSMDALAWQLTQQAGIVKSK